MESSTESERHHNPKTHVIKIKQAKNYNIILLTIDYDDILLNDMAGGGKGDIIADISMQFVILVPKATCHVALLCGQYIDYKKSTNLQNL